MVTSELTAPCITLTILPFNMFLALIFIFSSFIFSKNDFLSRMGSIIPMLEGVITIYK